MGLQQSYPLRAARQTYCILWCQSSSNPGGGERAPEDQTQQNDLRRGRA